MTEYWNIVLSILESPDSSLIGLQKVFTTSPITIGRAEDTDFIVSDPTVSRGHATLRITNDYSRVFITDTSTHGTFVSGKQVPKGLGSGFTIHDGDTIKVGSTVLRFELNLKQSVQSTFVGKIDRDFLNVPPEEQLKKPEAPEPTIVKETKAPQEKKSFKTLYILVIVLCVLVLVYLMFFQK